MAAPSYTDQITDLSNRRAANEARLGEIQSKATSEGRTKDDKHITETVEKKLKSDPMYKFESVHVSTFGGVVQLSGFVDNQDQSRRAEQVTRSVGGVNQIINALALKPQAMPPQTLAPTGQASGEPLAPPTATANPSPNSSTQKY